MEQKRTIGVIGICLCVVILTDMLFILGRRLVIFRRLFWGIVIAFGFTDLKLPIKHFLVTLFGPEVVEGGNKCKQMEYYGVWRPQMSPNRWKDTFY